MFKAISYKSIFIVAVFGILSINALAQTRGWVGNGSGQLGNGSTTDQPTPQTLSAVPDAAGVCGEVLHTIFLKANGRLVASVPSEVC